MKKIVYSEPNDYFPKEIRDKIFGKGAKKTSTAKKTSNVKKTGTKKKTSK